MTDGGVTVGSGTGDEPGSEDVAPVDAVGDADARERYAAETVRMADRHDPDDRV